VENREIQGVSSTLTLTEVLTVPIRKGDTKVQQAYTDILTNHPYFSLIPLSTSICERAAHPRANYNLKTPDALQIAVAIEAECDAFLTNDIKLQKVVEIKVLLVGEIELT
jgi:predicted nucleic acid-binding protein